MFITKIPHALRPSLLELPHVTTEGTEATLSHGIFGGLSIEPVGNSENARVTVTKNALNLPEELLKKRFDVDIEIMAFLNKSA